MRCRTDVEERESLIQGIEEEFGLLDLFFSDLSNYQQKAMKKAEKASKDEGHASPSLRTDDADLNKQILVGVEPHLKQIKTRLKFLYYILKHSSLKLPLHHLNTLWKCVIENGLTPEERDFGTVNQPVTSEVILICAASGLNWMTKACGNPATFDVKVMREATKFIFEQKLCSSLNYNSLSLSGLLCFMEYFR